MSLARRLPWLKRPDESVYSSEYFRLENESVSFQQRQYPISFISEEENHYAYSTASWAAQGGERLPRTLPTLKISDGPPLVDIKGASPGVAQQNLHRPFGVKVSFPVACRLYSAIL
jgi:hypothetical protein